jgi:hypothetical protein
MDSASLSAGAGDGGVFLFLTVFAIERVVRISGVKIR